MTSLGHFRRQRSFLFAVAGFVLFVLPARSAGGIQITGEVYQQGRPLAGALVQLWTYPSRLEAGDRGENTGTTAVQSVKSDRSGRFRLTAPSVGTWYVEVTAAGCVGARRDLVPLVRDEDLGIVTLPRAEVVTLSLKGSDGDSPIEVKVRPLLWPEGHSGSMQWVLQPGRMKGRGREGSLLIERAEGEAVLVKVLAPGYAEAVVEVGRSTEIPLQRAPSAAHVVSVLEPTGVRVKDGVVRAGDGLGWRVGVTDASGRVTLSAHLPTPVVVWASPGRFLDVTASGQTQWVLPGVRHVAGEVRDRATHAPLPEAVVWLRSDPGVWAKTDPRGRFSLLAPGTLSAVLGVAAAGYFAGDVAVRPRDASGATNVLLERADVLRGRVVDETGLPVGSVSIKGGPHNIRDIVGRNTGGDAQIRGVTNHEGFFRIESVLREVQYEIKFAATGFATRLELVGLARDPALDRPLTITLRRGTAIRGRVERPDGSPSDARIHLVPSGNLGDRLTALFGDTTTLREGAILTANAGRDGVFSFLAVPPGRWDLIARRAGFAPGVVLGLATTENSTTVEAGAVRLVSATSIAGVVYDHEGSALADVKVIVRAVRTTNTGAGWTRWSDVLHSATTDSAGRFVVDSLAPGQRLDLDFEKRGFVPKTLPAIAPPLDEELRISLDRAVTLSGRVKSVAGDPLANARVQLKLMDTGRLVSSSAGLVTSRSDSDGDFVLSDIAPGFGRLTVDLAGYRRKSIDLDLSQGPDVSPIELSMEPGAAIEGRVLSATGDAVPGAVVQAGGVSRASELTDNAGQYRLEGLSPGPVFMVALQGCRRSAKEEIVLRAGVQQLDLILPAGTTVGGRVLNHDGSAAPGVRVELAGIAGGPSSVTITESDGAFAFTGIGRGRYAIAAASPEGPRTSRVIDVETVAVDDVSLTLRSTGSLRGNVFGIPAVELLELDVFAQNEDSAVSGAVAGDGTYFFASLAPGTWMVTALGRQGRGQARVEVEAANESTLDLRLEEQARLRLHVSVDERPGLGVIATLTSPEGVALSNTTGGAGEVEFVGLQKGLYWVKIEDPARFLSYAQEATVSGDGEVAIQLKTGSIRVLVEDVETSAPVAGAALRASPLLSEPMRASSKTAYTDGRGSAQLDHLLQARYLMEAVATGYAPGNAVVTVEGNELPVTIRLTRNE